MKLISKNLLLIAVSASAACPVWADNAAPNYLAQVDARVEWPSPQKATRKKGVFVPATNVAKVTRGMTKQQVYTLLDVPHFSEGLFGVKTWNYLLNFYTGKDNEYVQCQFQIRYDRERRVQSALWQYQECANIVARHIAPPAPQVVEKIVYREVPSTKPLLEAPVAQWSRSFVVTFETSSADLDGQAMSVLEAAVAAAKRQNAKSLMVTGYTDTVGSEAINVRLREKRATNVAAALTMIAAQVGDALGISKSTSADLVVQTGDEVAEEANRRVVITLN